VDERRRLIEDVDKDRRYTIDTTIVRIMKSRKVLGHEHLVMECVEQLGHLFKVSLSLSLYDDVKYGKMLKFVHGKFFLKIF
jgi:hypothetical protein